MTALCQTDLVSGNTDLITGTGLDRFFDSGILSLVLLLSSRCFVGKFAHFTFKAR